MDNLARAAFMARQEGLTYGQWMAKYGTNPYAKKKPVILDRICPQCGAEIPKQRRRFCSDECSAHWHNRQKREERQNKHFPNGDCK